MASKNDEVLSNNFSKNPTNYNNNETETLSTATSMSSQATLNNPTVERNIIGSGNLRTSGVDVLPIEQQPRREENPFSFKHFLNRDTSSTASVGSSNSIHINNTTQATMMNSPMLLATATALSNEPQQHTSNSSNNNSNSITDEFITETNRISSNLKNLCSTPTTSTISTSQSFTKTSISTASSYQTSTGARPKVPQSTVSSSPHPLASTSVSSMSSLVGELSKMKRSPRFSSFDSQASLAEFAGGGSTSNIRNGGIIDRTPKDSGDSMSNFFGNVGQFDQKCIHRSCSNYDMDLPTTTSTPVIDVPSPLRRPSPTRSNRSNSGGVQQSSNPSKGVNLNLNALKQHLKLESQKSHPSSSGASGSGGGVSHGKGTRQATEFSAVLPDFVQDHWMDQWYYSDMNVSSPPNSPNSPVDFVEDILGIANPSEKCQTLPDFLSDGPIIHSSSRLADVATGLPDLDSPEENSPSLQLARLELENHRLRRELDESRLTLAEQTRRAGELERRLEQARCNETAYSMSLAQSMGQVEENLDQSKKRAAAAQNQVAKLKQQVKQLTAEVDALRRENESLREDGAVGGDRVTRRPSRTQQVSRDLMRAASNAENNLRELLSGVENLRLMAATIENMDRIAIDSNNQPNPINEEFLSDCIVDFDDFSGPAL